MDAVRGRARRLHDADGRPDAARLPAVRVAGAGRRARREPPAAARPGGSAQRRARPRALPLERRHPLGLEAVPRLRARVRRDALRRRSRGLRARRVGLLRRARARPLAPARQVRLHRGLQQLHARPRRDLRRVEPGLPRHADRRLRLPVRAAADARRLALLREGRGEVHRAELGRRPARRADLRLRKAGRCRCTCARG